jgi:phosphatidate cytidylyltransferase
MSRQPDRNPFKTFLNKEFMIRMASAAVLIPVVLWVIFTGSWPFLLLLSVGVALLGIEWGIMSAPKLSARMSVAIVMAILSALFCAYLTEDILLSLLVLGFGTFCAALYIRWLKGPFLDAAYGVFYIGLPILVLMWIRESREGTYWVLFAFLIAWSADSAAYLVGRLIGGPKLWERFSPNKTWSGFAGGVIAGMLMAATLSDITGLFSSSAAAGMVGLVVALATMAGDLWESVLKRRYGVKDSGDLIPGHGGLLDRVDGLMFAVMAVGGVKLLVSLGTVI